MEKMSIFELLLKINEKIIEYKIFEESKTKNKEIKKILSLNLENINSNKINEKTDDFKNFSRTIFLGESNVGKTFIINNIFHQKKERAKNSIDFYIYENMVYLNTPNFNKYENIILNFSDLFCNNLVLIINEYNLETIEKIKKINKILNEKNDKNNKKFILIFIDFFNKGNNEKNFDIIIQKITKIKNKDYIYFNPNEEKTFDNFILNLKNSFINDNKNNLSLNEVFNEIKNLKSNSKENKIENNLNDILDPFYSYKISDNKFILEIEVSNLEKDELIFDKNENNFIFKAKKKENNLKENKSIYLKNNNIKDGEYLLNFNIDKNIKINEKTQVRNYDEDIGVLTYSYDLEKNK